MTRLTSMGERPLVGLQPCLHPRALERGIRERGVGDVQSHLVADGFEYGQRLVDERGQLLRALRLAVDSEAAPEDPAAELSDTVAGRGGSLGEGICTAERVVALARPAQGVAELDLEGEVKLDPRYERGGTLEQADGGAVILAADGAVACGGQAAPSPRCQLVVVGQPELGPVAVGLLEVVAEELVELDERGRVLLEPESEALVEVRAHGFRERVVGGVAEQEVAEAEAVLARE